MRFFIITLLLSFSRLSSAQSNDSIEVIKVTEKYIQAFYQSKPDWLLETLHPELVKRTVKSFQNSDTFIVNSGQSEMAELSKVFNANGKFNLNSKADVRVLDLFKDIATVKLTAEKWVDYLHLAKLNGNWQIVNVIWIMI